MNLEERIEAFVQLRVALESLTLSEREILYKNAVQHNPWFTSANIDQALLGIGKFLTREVLINWTKAYSLPTDSKKIGVAMAGNIPLVGFHDLLCVLISGHTLIAKLSTQDNVLMQFIGDTLKSIDSRFQHFIFFKERLNNVDAVIATGSNNTARYFEYYFRKIPHIIRKNRSSCAVILGEETESDLIELGKDVFSYFGLGCRNVSKLYVPEDFNLKKLMKAWEVYSEIVFHHKYANNYQYQHSILLVNLIHFFDNGSIILSQSNSLVSPISVVYYEFYKDQDDLKIKLGQYSAQIQCLVSMKGWYPTSIPFGKSQQPEVWEYADNTDTISFLSSGI